MNKFVLFMISAVMLGGYCAQKGYLPGIARYLPEVISAVILVIVVVLGVTNRFKYVRPAYWLVFMAVLLVMVCGAITNGLETGPMFAGMRSYLRPIPLFFLPAV